MIVVLIVKQQFEIKLFIASIHEKTDEYSLKQLKVFHLSF